MSWIGLSVQLGYKSWFLFNFIDRSGCKLGVFFVFPLLFVPFALLQFCILSVVPLNAFLIQLL